jgi:hypothetical protein
VVSFSKDSPPPFSMSSSPCLKQQVSKHSTHCVPLQEKQAQSCSTELCLSIGRKSGSRGVEIPGFPSLWGIFSLVVSVKGCIVDTYELIQTRCILSSLGSTQEKGERRALRLLFASLAWVSVEQRDRDLQSTASMGHSISRRSFRKFYLIALEPHYSPKRLLMADWTGFSTAVTRMLRGGRTRPLASSRPCGNQDRTRSGATHD